MRETDICDGCGNEYKSIGKHWCRSDCDYPNITYKQHQVITGLLMGDGYVESRNTPRLRATMVSNNYLQYLENLFGKLSNGVKLSEKGNEKYQDKYTWSISHPSLQKYRDWYNSGKKVWPEDLILTPTVLKHWYCGDGTKHRNTIVIAMWNENERTKKVSNIFERSGLPSPSNYNINQEKSVCDAQFTVDQSKELWKYMGEPLPDFEYKWPQGGLLLKG